MNTICLRDGGAKETERGEQDPDQLNAATRLSRAHDVSNLSLAERVVSENINEINAKDKPPPVDRPHARYCNTPRGVDYREFGGIRL
jgi:hypothetical protein